MLKVTQYYAPALSGEFGTASSVRGWSQALAAAGAVVKLAVDREQMRLPSPEGVECLPLSHVLQGRVRLPSRPELLTRDVDIVVLHGGWVLDNLIVGACAFKRGVPYVVTAHGVYHPRVLARRKVALKRAWNVLLERRHLSRALAVHCFFADEQDDVRRLGVDVATVAAPNGFAAPLDVIWQGSNDGQLMWLGRFDPECKGLDLLLEAMHLLPVHERPRLALHGPDWHREKRSVAHLNAELGLEEWVTLGEAVYGDEKRKLLASAAGFVYPSRWEAFGISVVEAVSLGLPTLVTPYPLGRFLAAQGGAILAEATAPGLAEGLRRVRAPEAAQTGRKGAKVVREALSWDLVAGSWLKQVEALLRGGG